MSEYINHSLSPLRDFSSSISLLHDSFIPDHFSVSTGLISSPRLLRSPRIPPSIPNRTPSSTPTSGSRVDPAMSPITTPKISPTLRLTPVRYIHLCLVVCNQVGCIFSIKNSVCECSFSILARKTSQCFVCLEVGSL